MEMNAKYLISVKTEWMSNGVLREVTEKRDMDFNLISKTVKYFYR